MKMAFNASVGNQYAKLFTGYNKFNAMQQALLNPILRTNDSIVIAAPTSAGKTVAFELATIWMLQLPPASIMHLLELDAKPKAIYIAPSKALCNERWMDWQPRFASLNVQCSIITGDSENIDWESLNRVQIVVTTPEKWDSITRNYQTHKQFINSVVLMMIDEIHLLNNVHRGAAIEAIVSRSRKLIKTPLRFIVASATIPNIDDLVAWLKASDINKTVLAFDFSTHKRPVNIQQHVMGYQTSNKQSTYSFDISLQFKLPEIIQKYSNNRGTLIFCPNRNSAEVAASHLSMRPTGLCSITEQMRQQLIECSEIIENEKLKLCVLSGIAFHHAGLSPHDRGLIEMHFTNNLIKVICCTPTLSLGINLPAHLVIVKSTKVYWNNHPIDYDSINLIQMIGRAGRTKYHTDNGNDDDDDDNNCGVAVIMTKKSNVANIKELLKGSSSSIESHLSNNLDNFLNVEIALGNIQSWADAQNWINTTFLSIRAKQAPTKYGVRNDEDVQNKLEELLMSSLQKLVKSHVCIREIDHRGIKIISTPYGALISCAYISLETLDQFFQLSGHHFQSMSQLMIILSECKEFNDVTLRSNEKSDLNQMNQFVARYKLRQPIKTLAEKIYCLWQGSFTQYKSQNLSLMHDMKRIITTAERLTSCLIEFLLIQNMGNPERRLKIFNYLLCAIQLTKCIKHNMWLDSKFMLLQVPDMDNKSVEDLYRSKIQTIHDFIKVSPIALQEILKQSSIETCSQQQMALRQRIPFYDIEFQCQNIGNMRIIVTQINRVLNYDLSPITLLIGNDCNNLLVHKCEQKNIIYAERIFDIIFIIPEETKTIYVHIIHDKLVGADYTVELDLKELRKSLLSSITFKRPCANSAARTPYITILKSSTTHDEKTLPKYMKRNSSTTNNNNSDDKSSKKSKQMLIESITATPTDKCGSIPFTPMNIFPIPSISTTATATASASATNTNTIVAAMQATPTINKIETTKANEDGDDHDDDDEDEKISIGGIATPKYSDISSPSSSVTKDWDILSVSSPECEMYNQLIDDDTKRTTNYNIEQNGSNSIENIETLTSHDSALGWHHTKNYNKTNYVYGKVPNRSMLPSTSQNSQNISSIRYKRNSSQRNVICSIFPPTPTTNRLTGPSNEEFLMWYAVTLEFSQKPRDQRTFMGFKKIYNAVQQQRQFSHSDRPSVVPRDYNDNSSSSHCRRRFVGGERDLGINSMSSSSENIENQPPRHQHRPYRPTRPRRVLRNVANLASQTQLSSQSQQEYSLTQTQTQTLTQTQTTSLASGLMISEQQRTFDEFVEFCFNQQEQEQQQQKQK